MRVQEVTTAVLIGKMLNPAKLSKSGVKVVGGKGKIRPCNPLQEALDKFAMIGGTDDHAGDCSSTVHTIIHQTP